MSRQELTKADQVQPLVTPQISDPDERWWAVLKFRDSVSSIYVMFFGVGTLGATTGGIGALVAGDPASGFYFGAAAGVVGAFVGLTKLLYHAVGKWDEAEMRKFNTWRAWLLDKYGLILTQAENDALVKHHFTTVEINGKTEHIKLLPGSQDTTVPHKVLVERGRNWLELTKQQMQVPATNPLPDAFPDYSTLPKWLRSHMQNLHQQWSALNKLELNVEDRYTVNAVAEDYLPQSFALFNAIPAEDKKKRSVAEWLLLDQLQAMARQLWEIQSRQGDAVISAMKAHGLFLNRKAPLKKI